MITQTQEKAIQLHLQGKTWKQISVALNVPYPEVLNWREDREVRARIHLLQDLAVEEITRLFSDYLTVGFETLHEIATNPNAPVSEQRRAAESLISNVYKFMHSNRFALSVQSEQAQPITLNITSLKPRTPDKMEE